jgi:ABC-type transport system involved in multi-copper enzyme maturation permease subunit
MMMQMRQLLWKDYRLNRGLLILGVVALVGVYVVGLASELSHTWPAMPSAKSWADALYSYGHLALGVLPYVAALLGGNAIACERADRSAYFLAYLPPTKWRILTSKFIVAACAVVIFWGGNLLLMYTIAPLLAPEPADFMYMFGTPSAALPGCLFTFGIGWLGSAYFEKPTVPVLAALASPVVLGMALFTLASLLGISRIELAEWSGTVGLIIGVVAFGVGTWYYCRRVEP